MASGCPQGLQGCLECFPRANEIVDSEDLESQEWDFTKTGDLDKRGATAPIGEPMSDVYKAVLRLPGSPPQLCAVKRLKAGLAEERYTVRHNRELEIATRVMETIDRHGHFDNHSRLLFVSCLGVYQKDDFIHLVMDYMPQGNLLPYLDIPWGEEDTRIVAKQVLSALSFLHKENIAHRDIKAANIFPMLSHDGTLHIKVGDFGASKHVPPDSKEALVTRIEMPESTAPEIFFEALVEYTSKVDIYSLGTLLF